MHEIEKRNEAYTARYTVDGPPIPMRRLPPKVAPASSAACLAAGKAIGASARTTPRFRPRLAFCSLSLQTMRGWMKWLQLAAEAWDRCQQARMVIGREGLVLVSSGRAHPAVTIERDSRLAFARLIRELDLDAEPPASWSRPPALHSNRRNLRGGIGIKLDD